MARNQYIIDIELFEQKIWELVLQYNYTLNSQGVYKAIKYMYTYWPDPKNITHIRDQYINVNYSKYIHIYFDFYDYIFIMLHFQLLSDFHYVAPFDKMAKLLIEKHVPTYLYVLNTTVEALRLPQWRSVPHDTELLWLTGAPFMDVGKFTII